MSYFPLTLARILIRISDANSVKSELDNTARQIVVSLANEIQEIGVLLQLQHIENAQADPGSTLAHFIASGQEPDFASELQSLISPDEVNETVAKGGRFLGQLIGYLVRYLAVVKIQGTLQRRPDGKLDLWVEIRRRRNEIVGGVGMVVVESASGDELDAKGIQLLAQELAIKLVFQMGQTRHLASSARSLAHFLDGLKASKEYNRWSALSSYRAAIQIEEAERGSFGIGHYNLGATLISLGEFDEGLQHLEQADVSGPPIAETQYMLALAKASIYWNDLHTEPGGQFAEIERRCQNALKLRHNFADAAHLLGAVCYQRGKLRQRETSCEYQENEKSYQGDTNHTSVPAWQFANGRDNASNRRVKNEALTLAAQDYRQAVKELRRAIRMYDRQIKALSGKPDTFAHLNIELTQILRARLMTTHNLADALRSLGYYEEADIFYELVRIVFPADMRTIIDSAMNYCLAAQWQRADEFLSKHIMTIRECAWNADINFFQGWALLGSIADGLPNLNRQQQGMDHVELFRRAIMHLDIGLSQRPRFFTRWEHTNWQKELWDCVKHQDDATLNMYNENIDPNNTSNYIPQLVSWLSWIADSNNYDYFGDRLIQWIQRNNEQMQDYPNINNKRADFYTERDVNEASRINFHQYPRKSFATIYSQYREHCRLFASLLVEIEKSGRLNGMTHAWEKYVLAAEMLDNWKRAKVQLEKDLPALVDKAELKKRYAKKVKYWERWSIGVFLDVSVLCVRVLLEAWSYEVAWEVAEAAIKIIDNWIYKIWETSYAGELMEDGKLFRFGPFMQRFQLATLYAYKSYAAWYLNEDLETSRRIQATGWSKKNNVKEILKYAEHDVSNALKYLPRHTLAMFVRACLYKSNGRLDDAAIEFNRCLGVIEPYDPVDYIANWRKVRKATSEDVVNFSLLPTTDRQLAVEPDEFGKEMLELKNRWSAAYRKIPLRDRMRRQEFVSGQRQFLHFVNRSKVNKMLSDIYDAQGKFDLSVIHLSEAAANARYRDIEADYLLLLAERLERLDRFRDAQAVIDILRSRRSSLEAQTFSITKMRQLEIQDCIFNTRLHGFRFALDMDSVLQKRWTHEESRFAPLYTDAGSQNKDTGKDQHTSYRERLLYKRLQESYEKLSKFLTRALIPSAIRLPKPIYQFIRDDDLSRAETLSLAEAYLVPDRMIALIVNVRDKKLDDRQETNERGQEKSEIERPLLEIGAFFTAADVHQLANGETPYLNISESIQIRMLEFLCHESLQALEQSCQLLNNAAYNRIELNVEADADHAVPNKAFSNQEDIKSAIDLMVALIRVAEKDMPVFARRYKRYLSNYYDTNAWGMYRQVEKKILNYPPVQMFKTEAKIVRPSQSIAVVRHLQHARKELAEKALVCDKANAMVYYHLARTHLALTEQVWSSALPLEISVNIRSARRYWRAANASDINNRLQFQLAWLGQYIEEYSAKFQETFMSKLSLGE